MRVYACRKCGNAVVTYSRPERCEACEEWRLDNKNERVFREVRIEDLLK